MIKTLLLIAFFFLVLGVLRKARRVPPAGASATAARAPEAMVKCAYCGVNQPVSESILTRGNYYCCNEHRQAAEARDAG